VDNWTVASATRRARERPSRAYGIDVPKVEVFSLQANRRVQDEAYRGRCGQKRVFPAVLG
jgi:hypothetical protein